MSECGNKVCDCDLLERQWKLSCELWDVLGISAYVDYYERWEPVELNKEQRRDLLARIAVAIGEDGELIFNDREEQNGPS
jgi:hypothetical protein